MIFSYNKVPKFKLQDFLIYALPTHVLECDGLTGFVGCGWPIQGCRGFSSLGLHDTYMGAHFPIHLVADCLEIGVYGGGLHLVAAGAGRLTSGSLLFRLPNRSRALGHLQSKLPR